MSIWMYLENNWQGIWRALAGCVGLEVLIEPMTRNRRRVFGRRTGTARVGATGIGKARFGTARTGKDEADTARTGKTGAGTVRMESTGADGIRTHGVGVVRQSGGYRRMVLFLVMTAAVIAVKLLKYQFYVDMPLTIGIFAVYLVYMEKGAFPQLRPARSALEWAKRPALAGGHPRPADGISAERSEGAFPPLEAIYTGCVLFLCMDFYVAAANTVYFYTALRESLAGKILVETVFTVVLMILSIMMRRFVLVDGECKMKGRDFALLILALTPYLFIRCNSNLYGVEGEVGFGLGITLLLVMAASFGTLVGNRNALLVQMEHARRLEMEAELREKEKQFEVRRETIDEVNRRYHDMMKYARLFDLEQDPSGLIHYLEERMTENSSMGSLIKTGNSMLDMILWEKTEICERDNLRFIPNVDARGLDFVEDFDLHTIVGNALDNAIEAARQVEEEEKREIHIRVTRVNRMLFLVTTNFFTGERIQEGGQLLTTKPDKNAHGYGLRNIIQAAERYDGTAVYDVSDDQFTLTVMLPLPELTSQKK